MCVLRSWDVVDACGVMVVCKGLSDRMWGFASMIVSVVVAGGRGSGVFTVDT